MHRSVEEVEAHVIKLRKSYKHSIRLLNAINKTIVIFISLSTTSALVALIPTVPVAVVGIAAIPAVLGIIKEKIGFAEKIERYKYIKNRYTRLHSYIVRNRGKEGLLPKVITKLNKIECDDKYIQPIKNL